MLRKKRRKIISWLVCDDVAFAFVCLKVHPNGVGHVEEAKQGMDSASPSGGRKPFALNLLTHALRSGPTKIRPRGRGMFHQDPRVFVKEEIEDACVFDCVVTPLPTNLLMRKENVELRDELNELKAEFKADIGELKEQIADLVAALKRGKGAAETSLHEEYDGDDVGED